MSIIGDIVRISRELGKEGRELAMLGEGNTSAKIDDGTYWVKASGTRMSEAKPGGFLKMDFRKVFKLLHTKRLSDLEVMMRLRKCTAGGKKGQPSSEAFMHAISLTEGGAKWAGHTHPAGVLSILCSKAGAKPFLKGLFPDEIVYCGKNVGVLEYQDPGVKLAFDYLREIRRFKKRHGYPPRLILLLNHGILALGQTAEEVVNVTRMADKWARILLGTRAFGGPRYITENQAKHIDDWPAEHYRRRVAAFDKGGKG